MVSPPKRNYQKKRRTRNNKKELDFMFIRTNYRFLFEGVKKRYKDFIIHYDLKKDVDYRVVSKQETVFKKDCIDRLVKEYIKNLNTKMENNNLQKARIILHYFEKIKEAEELKKEAEELKKEAEDMEKQAEKQYKKKINQVDNDSDSLQYEQINIYEQLEGTEYKSLQNEINRFDTGYIVSPNDKRKIVRIARNSFSRK